MNAKKTCGKDRYPDEYDAGKRLKRLRAHAERNNHRAPVRYYYHSECGGYHLTSRPEREATGWQIS